VSRDEIAGVARFQDDLQQVPGVEAEDRPAVGVEVADAPEARHQPLRRIQVRDAHHVVHLAGAIAPFVDGGDLHRELEADRAAAGRRQARCHLARKLRP
jgi:hypothetical protein